MIKSNVFSHQRFQIRWSTHLASITAQNHMVNYDTFTDGFHRTKSLFNQSLLISTPRP